MNFAPTIQQADPILTKCAIPQRLRHKEGIQLDPLLFLTLLNYDTLGR